MLYSNPTTEGWHIYLNRQNKQYWALAATTYTLFILTGAANVVINATVAGVTSALSVGMAQIGTIISVFSMGRMATLFVSGVLTDRLGSKKVLLGATFSYLLFFAIIPSTGNLYIAMLAAFFAGAANGMGDASGMPLLIDLFKENAAAALSYAQLFFGVGAFFTPMAVSLLLKNNLSWTVIYWVFFIIAAVVLVAKFLLHFPSVQKHMPVASSATADVSEPEEERLLTEGSLLAVITFICGCLVSILMVWTVSYLNNFRGLNEVAAVQTLALYNLGCIGSALFTARLSRYINTANSLIINLSITLAGLLIVVFSNHQFAIQAGYVVVGMGCGALYSLTVTAAGRLFYKRKGAAVGTVGTASAIAGVLTPLWMSALIERLPINTAYYSLFVIVLLGLATSILFRKKYTAFLRRNSRIGHIHSGKDN